MPSRSVQVAQPGHQFLRDVARTALAHGAGPLIDLAYGVRRVGNSLEGFAHLSKGGCALAYARGGEALTDVDLHLFADNGAELAADEAPDDLPTVVYCSTVEQRILVSASVAQGHGPLAIALHDVPATRASEVARAVGARNFLRQHSPEQEPWPGLERKLARHRTSLGGRWIDLRRVALPADARIASNLTFSLPEKRCVDVLISPGQGVAQLEVTAADENGRIYARADSMGSDRALLLCNTGPTTHNSLSLRPRLGQGAAVVVLSATRDAFDALDLHPAITRHFATPSLLERSGSRRLPDGASQLGKHHLKGGTITSQNVPTSGCLSLSLLSGPRLVGLQAQVWDTNGDLIADEKAPTHSPLFVCANAEVRLDLVATHNDGEVSIVAQPLTFPAQLTEQLVSQPLSAGRLLRRLEMLGGFAALATLKSVQSVSLSSTSLVRWKQRLAPGECGQFVVGRAGSGGGLRLRLLDAASGEELDLAHGRNSVSAQTCIPAKREATIVVELSTEHGQAAALVSSRAFRLDQEQLSATSAR